MSTLNFAICIVCNIVVTILVCGYMNRKTAEQLLEYYYSDKLEAERRLTMLEFKQKKLVLLYACFEKHFPEGSRDAFSVNNEKSPTT